MPEKTKERWIDFGKTLFCMGIATVIAYLLKNSGDTTDAMAVIYMLMVVIVSRITNGYFWGIFASGFGVLSANFMFTYPYLKFNFSLTGYPVTFVAMLIISCMISAVTSQYKKQTQAVIAMANKLQETYEEQRAMEVIAEKEKLKANLLRALSHDLRTPLTTIIGASSTILENEDYLDKETHDYLVKDIKEESQWLLRMVENLLAVTHISTDTMKVIKAPEVAEEIIAEASAHFKERLSEGALTIKVPDELLIVPMDGTLIEQVIINLMDNAIKHGGSQCHIHLSLEQEDQWAVFRVSDDGVGIKEEDLPKIFDYGEQLENSPASDSSRGFGIGLPTCRTIILAHSGELTVASTPGEGTTFTFKLPLDPEQESS